MDLLIIYNSILFRFVYMPFTSFHFGVALPFILWDWKKKRIDALSALVGTVIIDTRSVILFLFSVKNYFFKIYNIINVQNVKGFEIMRINGTRLKIIY